MRADSRRPSAELATKAVMCTNLVLTPTQLPLAPTASRVPSTARLAATSWSVQSISRADKFGSSSNCRLWPQGALTCRFCNGQHCSAGRKEPWRSSSHLRLPPSLTRSFCGCAFCLAQR